MIEMYDLVWLTSWDYTSHNLGEKTPEIVRGKWSITVMIRRRNQKQILRKEAEKHYSDVMLGHGIPLSKSRCTIASKRLVHMSTQTCLPGLCTSLRLLEYIVVGVSLKKGSWREQQIYWFLHISC